MAKREVCPACGAFLVNAYKGMTAGRKIGKFCQDCHYFKAIGKPQVIGRRV